MYTATPIQRFMLKCKDLGVNWAVFSDRYGVWFSNIEHEWYEKDPNDVTKEEFRKLVEDFDYELSRFEEIWFYYNPGRFHRLYKRLLRTTSLKNRIRLFTHLEDISLHDQAVNRSSKTNSLNNCTANNNSHNKCSKNYLDETCSWLHSQLESLPMIKVPFDIVKLPLNGIYFFYEQGEYANHGNSVGSIGINNNTINSRIVRVGTHKENNFRSRISEHFLLNEVTKMKFTIANPKLSDRSIFRKNIGRALLNKENDCYLKIWNIDFLPKDNRLKFNLMRNIAKERQIESQITKMLRETFSFRYIPLEGQETRIGKEGLESRLIGTISSCSLCQPSNNWLGKYSPIREIRNGKLWLSQYLHSTPLIEQDKIDIATAIEKV